MLISPEQIWRCWLLRPETILHVGAHDAEERVHYEECGWATEQLIWVEALPDKAELLAVEAERRTNETVIQALAWSVSGETVTFHRANNGQSSSALSMKEHTTEYPTIRYIDSISLVSTALDDVEQIWTIGQLGLVNIDVQGAELRVLRGMNSTLERTLAVYSEYSTRELYEDGARLEDLDELLAGRGFVRVDWQATGRGWGDALWLREEIVPSLVVGRRSIRRVWTMLSTMKRRCLKFGRLIRSVD